MARKAVRIRDKLPQFSEQVKRRAERAMTRMLITGAAQAAVMTPIDTSTLLNSQYRRIFRSAERVRGVVGYSASYALPVHDPDVAQTFRRSTAEKEFLRKGFEESREVLRSIVREEMKP